MLRSVSLPRPFDSEKYLSRKKLLERRKKKSPMSQKGWEMSEEEEEEEEMCDVTGEAEIKMETPEDFPVGEEFSAGDESMPAGSSDFMGEVEHPPPGSGEFPAGEESLPLETSGEQIGDTTNDGNAEEDENENPFAGDESEDEVEVTIGEIRQNVPFTTKSDPRSVMVASSAGKIDIDPSPMADGVVIYDVDLASLDEKPWRKPGADPSDYFNYGFTEETWNLYCERQKKLRAEFGGKQSAINRFITNSISITNPLAPISSRQVPTIGGEVNKILVEGSEFRQNGRDRGNRSSDGQNNVIRTVITASTPSNIPTLSASVPDFSRPPPMMMPTLTSSSTESSSEPPIPGSESAMVSNPIQTSVGMNVPTAVSSSSVGTPELQPNPIITTPQGIPTIGATINTSLPPPGFNFAMPPPNLRPPPPASMSIPPPTFNPMMPPPNFAQPPPFARPMPPRMVPPPGISRLPPLLPQEEFNDLNVMGRRRESNEYSGGSGEKKERRERERDERRERDRGKSSGESEGEEEQHRRSRHRKRSRTPLKRKVKHDVDSVGRRSGKEREERRGGGERDRERDSKSAHRSRHRSISVESRRRRDDRKRRDDEGDKKKSRRHEKSDDRSDRKRSKRTAPAEEQASAADERGSAAETVVKVEVEEPAEE